MHTSPEVVTYMTLLDDNTRVVVLAVLESIQRECDTALECPEISFTSICRIAALARQALAPHAA